MTQPFYNIADYITADPETLGGQPVFKGTRVPVETLFDYQRREYDIIDFLAEFPSVTDEQVVAVLALAYEALISKLP